MFFANDIFRLIHLMEKVLLVSLPVDFLCGVCLHARERAAHGKFFAPIYISNMCVCRAIAIREMTIIYPLGDDGNFLGETINLYIHESENCCDFAYIYLFAAHLCIFQFCHTFRARAGLFSLFCYIDFSIVLLPMQYSGERTRK